VPNLAVTAPITGLSHVQLNVTDVAASEAWYTAVFGMERMTAADDGAYVALRHRPSRVVIVLSRRTDGSTDLGPPLDHLAFAVADRATLEGWADHLTEAGIVHPGIVLEGVNHSLQLRDPDGIEIELAAPPDRA
jgi:glyoxylase I family protein